MTQARWPGMMKRRTAAEYCDMSEATFVREVLAGRLPIGVMLGGREHWSKDALDKTFAKLSGDDGDIPSYRRETMERYGEAA